MEQDEKQFNLENRLLSFGAEIIKFTRTLNQDQAERHISHQLLRSGTAPSSHHGEAQGAESQRDFIHKMSIGLKELRESERWLKLTRLSIPVNDPNQLNDLIKESDELIRIFAASINTAKKRL